MATETLTLTRTRYKGTSVDTQVANNYVGNVYASGSAEYYRIKLSFTPTKTLSSVTFTLQYSGNNKVTAITYRSGYTTGSTVIGKTSTSGSSFTWNTSTRSATRTISGTFNAGTKYHFWVWSPDQALGYVVISSYSATGTVKEYTVSYNANGGTSTKTSETGSSVTLPTATQCTRTGYQLAGWATSSTATSASYSPGASYTPTAAITLYAVWTANKLQLAYNPNGGTPTASGYSLNSSGFITNGTTVYFQTRNYGGSKVNLYDGATFGLTKTGHTFDGNWYLYNSAEGITSTVRSQSVDYEIADFYHYSDKTKNINNSATTICYLYAGWTPNTYQVTYNANGGTGAPSAQTKTHDVSLTLSSTKPTRAGYVFQGWATSANGEVVYAPGASYTANSAVTLYAVWKADVSPVYIKDSSGNFNAYYAYIANSNGEFELYSAYIYTNNEWKECIM